MTTIDITPRGYSVEGGAERIAAATEAFNEQTAVVANAATSFFDTHGSEIGWHLKDTNDKDAAEDFEEVMAAIKQRREAQEELLRAVAGVPACTR
jgi:hypothetical protein